MSARVATLAAHVVASGSSAGNVHPLDELTPSEQQRAANAIRAAFSGSTVRFNYITLSEPPKADLVKYIAGEGPMPTRMATAVILLPQNGVAPAHQLEVKLPRGDESAEIVSSRALGPDTHPLLTPDDCDLAERIAKEDTGVKALLKDRYNITNMDLLACDPWSIHIAGGPNQPLPSQARLVQTFLYLRHDADDNHYAHPIDVLPVVDIAAGKVVHVDMQEQAPKLPTASVNYHQNKVGSNSYLETSWRTDPPAPLEVIQPNGPSFRVDGNLVSWQKWTLRVGFNYREGLVLHDVKYDNRPVLWRASLVEMAVPYGDPHPPFERKCAFDVGDYGLGYCANDLTLGCDCLGSIHYFPATLSNSKGEPYTIDHAVCMHEEDAGVLWKHVEYRNGHNEARRSRRLVLSFIATVVNYEYLFYWYLMQDGSIEFEIKLSGELSTNLRSSGEGDPEHGVLVAPDVNAQVHQHNFCARLDFAVDGHDNTVVEVNVDPAPAGPKNPFGNEFKANPTTLETEQQAQRDIDPARARTWTVQSASSINTISGKPTAYKLVPYTRGPAGPPLMTSPGSTVTARGLFATKALWVTPYTEGENWAAGEFPLQSSGGDGLPAYTAANRNIKGRDIVVWHSFGVTHVPRPEDFPVMPCASTGFTLMADGFFKGNPAVDLAPTESKSSTCSSSGKA